MMSRGGCLGREGRNDFFSAVCGKMILATEGLGHPRGVLMQRVSIWDTSEGCMGCILYVKTYTTLFVSIIRNAQHTALCFFFFHFSNVFPYVL